MKIVLSGVSLQNIPINSSIVRKSSEIVSDLIDTFMIHKKCYVKASNDFIKLNKEMFSCQNFSKNEKLFVRYMQKIGKEEGRGAQDQCISSLGRFLDACSGLYKTSTIELFRKSFDSLQSLTISTEFSILDVWQGSEYACVTCINFRFFRNFFTAIHRPSEFLPWHRWFILEMENLLKEVDCRVTIPYWDWSLVSNDPFNDTMLFSDDYLGSHPPGV